MTHIRQETPADHQRIREVETAAFGGDDEAAIVDRLREEADPLVSLVAERDGRLVGHICFSPVLLDENPREAEFGALAPIAVEPAIQLDGIGSALIEAGLAECRALGWKAVFLVGSPAYYGRFGFELAVPRGFTYGEAHFDPALQVLELEAGSLDGCGGRVLYAPVFGQTRGT